MFSAFLLVAFQSNAQIKFFKKNDIQLEASYHIQPYNAFNIKTDNEFDYIKFKTESKPSYSFGISINRKFDKAIFSYGYSFLHMHVSTDIELGYPALFFLEENELMASKEIVINFDKSSIFHFRYEQQISKRLSIGGGLNFFVFGHFSNAIVKVPSQILNKSFFVVQNGELIDQYSISYVDHVNVLEYKQSIFFIPEVNVNFNLNRFFIMQFAIKYKPWSRQDLFTANLNGISTFNDDSSPPSSYGTEIKINHTINSKFLYPTITLKYNVSNMFNKKAESQNQTKKKKFNRVRF